tara:strand:+ start:909 stop:1382 length:474 start_codon:yes stop_codon:yes gene_type:complete
MVCAITVLLAIASPASIRHTGLTGLVAMEACGTIQIDHAKATYSAGWLTKTIHTLDIFRTFISADTDTADHEILFANTFGQTAMIGRGAILICETPTTLGLRNNAPPSTALLAGRALEGLGAGPPIRALSALSVSRMTHKALRTISTPGTRRTTSPG